MAHELRARTGNLLPASEIARRLAVEFAYTRTSTSEGAREALARAEWIERAPAKLFLGQHELALEHATKLRNLSPGDAMAFEIGDDAKKTKRFVVLPGEPINFGYASKEEEVWSKELIERCARVLDCDVVVI